MLVINTLQIAPTVCLSNTLVHTFSLSVRYESLLIPIYSAIHVACSGISSLCSVLTLDTSTRHTLVMLLCREGGLKNLSGNIVRK